MLPRLSEGYPKTRVSFVAFSPLLGKVPLSAPVQVLSILNFLEPLDVHRGHLR